MQIEVAKWTRVEAANGDPTGRAIVAATCYGALPPMTPGQRVLVMDNPDGFTVAATDSALGVVVLRYLGDVDLLAFGTREDGTPLEGATITVE